MAAIKRYDYLMKVMLIGSSRVGKTSIIKQYVEEFFNERLSSTIAIDFVIKLIRLKRKTIKLQIWDPAGQERYRVITSTYYPKTNGVLLVYDITNYESFEDIRRVWLPMMNAHALSDVPHLLIGNKSDLKERQVSREEGKKLAQELKVPFLEISAKTNNNISEVFEQLATSILKEMIETERLKHHQAIIREKEKKSNEQLLEKERKRNQQLLEDALANQGYILIQILKILVMGIAGAGKTSVKNQMIVGLPPSSRIRNSTMLFEVPIRTISRTVTKVVEKQSDDDSDTEWSIVNTDELYDMIASVISAQKYYTEKPVAMPTRSLLDKASTTGDAGISLTGEPIPVSSTPGIFSNSLPNKLSHSSSKPTAESSLSQSSSSESVDSVSKRQLIEHLGQGDLDKPMKCQWVHFIDTGGQPQFRELLPSVVHSMSMIMHVLRLSEGFDEHPQIEFYKEGKLCCEPRVSAYTSKAILQQTIQSIQVQSSLTLAEDVNGGMETQTRRPNLVIVGTHRDLESKCSETRAQKNAQIQKLVSPSRDNVIFCNGLEEAIFPLNAINPSDDDKKVISNIRREASKLFKVCSQHKVPLSWFMLEQDIRGFADDQGRRQVVSLKDCQTIAKSLDISYEALKAALSYFHLLNVFLYYPSLLPNVVFCDPQVPLTIISSLFFFSYELQSKERMEDVTLEGRWCRFRDGGILTAGMLEHERFKVYFVPGLFSPLELIQLLQYLFIAAPLSSSKVASSNTLSPSDEFFLPCLLPTLSPTEISYQSQSLPSDSPHLLLAFPSGCVPSGIFGNIIVRLRSLYTWKIYSSCAFRNFIEFHLPDVPLTATLIDSFNYIEVRVQVLISGTSALLYEYIFPQIRLAITKSIEDAASSLKFVDCTPVAMFLCGETSDRCSSNPHAAEILGGECWRCTENPHICKLLTKEQLLWLKHPIDSNSKNLLEITDYLKDLEKTDLYNLGLVLGLHHHRVTDLRERCGCLEFCDCIVDCWLQRVDDVEAMNMVPSWRNLVQALKHPRLRQTGLADRVAKSRKILL